MPIVPEACLHADVQSKLRNSRAAVAQSGWHCLRPEFAFLTCMMSQVIEHHADMCLANSKQLYQLQRCEARNRICEHLDIVSSGNDISVLCGFVLKQLKIRCANTCIS